MAATISLGQATYLIDFANGQAAHGRTPPYVQFATDFDTNFVTLRTTVNQLVAEISAIQGTNAGLGMDLVLVNDPAVTLENSGLIGTHSYVATIAVVTSTIDITAGDAMAAGVKVSSAANLNLSGPGGGAATHYLRLNASGVPAIDLNPSSSVVDIYTLTWDGAAYTAVTRAVQITFDGDEYKALRNRPATGSVWSALEYDAFSERVLAIERALSGLVTDGNAAAIGPFELVYAAGTVGLPAASFTSDPNTGLYSPAADQVGITTGGTLALLVDDNQQVDSPTQFRVRGNRTAVAQSVPDVTSTIIDFDEADETQIGDWTHNYASGTLSIREEYIVPVGGAGFYAISANAEFASNSTGDRRMTITQGGTDLAGDSKPAHGGAATQLCASTHRELAAGAVLRVEVEQDSGGNLDVTAVISAVRLW